MKKEAVKKKWPKEVVKAWKHRIEQYRYAIRKGRRTSMYDTRCCICKTCYPVDGELLDKCRICPFAVSTIARKNLGENQKFPCVSSLRIGAVAVDQINFRAALRARLKELIAIGRETGVIK